LSHEAKAKNKRSFRHDRKCGEWLKENVKHEGATKKGWNESQDVTRLKDIGVTKNESSRLQKIA